MNGPIAITRGGLVLASLAVVSASSWSVATPGLRGLAGGQGLGGTPTLGPEELVEAVAGAALVGTVVWLDVLAVLALTEVLTGALPGALSGALPGRLHAPGLPTARRLVATACGLSLVGLVPPATAGGPPAGGATDPDDAPGLTGLVLPDRLPTHPSTHPSAHPSARPSAHASAQRSPPAPAGTSPPARWVEVRPGDCLWRIAAERLPDGDDPAVVAAGWRALYAANRTRIGPDPHLLHPGDRLQLPRRWLTRPPHR